MMLAHAGTGIGSYGTQWLYLVVPFAVFSAIVGYLFATGTGDARSIRGVLTRIGDSLERLTGLPAWSSGGIGVGLFALIVAVIGFYWDVAWHIEFGRDLFIFTPAHMMIVVGLGLIVASAITSIVFATNARAETGRRFKSVVVPYSSMPLLLLGVGALMGFPLDEFWHGAYGIDVTMWGPTHLVMISGASLTPIALLLMFVEAKGARVTWLGRLVRETLAVALLMGMSTWTGEFDFGVPQFQQLYHPVLVAMAASIALTAARTLLGPGGALRVAIGFIAVRSLVALVLGWGLQVVIPRFPLYLGAALVVELAWRYRRLGSAISIVGLGLAIGTLGLAAEWAWMQAWGRHPWGPSLFPGVLTAVGVAVPGALLGTAIGDVLAGRSRRVRPAYLAMAGVALVALLATPLPRNDADLEGTLTTRAVAPGSVIVDLTLDDPALVERPDWFEAMSWQGGSMHMTPMRKIGTGRYRSAEAVPVGDDWKTLVRFANHDVLAAVPVYLPADPEIGASEIPVRREQSVEFRRDTDFLLREAREGPAWPAIVAYTAILSLALAWVTGLAFSYRAVARGGKPTAGPQGRAATRRQPERKRRPAISS